MPVNGRFKSHELGHVVAHADLRMLVVASGPPDTPDYPAMVAERLPRRSGQDPRALALDGAPRLRQVVDLGGGAAPGLLAPAAFAAAAEAVGPDEVAHAAGSGSGSATSALLMYTSGTTSHPKGCLLTHEALVRHGLNVRGRASGLTPDDRFWDPLPLFHIGGIVPMLGCLGLGATFYHAGPLRRRSVALRHARATSGSRVAYPAFETIWLPRARPPALRRRPT